MINHNQSIVRNGLVFAFDTSNPKSYKGGATTNYAVDANPRLTDLSYPIWLLTSSGTWQQKHSDAIQVFNVAGADISNMSNSGVTDWTNTYHAIWTYDQDLCRPVTTMRDFDGQWKAKSFGTGQTMTSMGLSAGMKYTISWLQWTDNASLYGADVGLYGNDTGGTPNFWDGRQTVQNTKLRTWQRVYATYTVSASRNMAAGLNCYMYGMSAGVGTTMKIADVQIEVGDHPTAYSVTSTRTAAQSLIDVTGNTTLTSASLSYNSDGTCYFNGSGNYMDFGTGGALTLGSNTPFTAEAWIKPTALTGYNVGIVSKVQADRGGVYSFMCCVNNSGTLAFYNNVAWYYSSTAVLTNNNWFHIVFSYNGSVMSYYINGVAYGTSTCTWVDTPAHHLFVGSWYSPNTFYDFNGTISSARLYNKALSAYEVKQNFGAHRGKYGV